MIRLSCDDACASDVRVADLARKFELDCTFYWPVEWHSLAYDNGYLPLDYVEALNIASEFEIGSHGITHRHLTKITSYEATQEIVGSKFILERMFKKPITKFCPSRGYTTPELTELTKKYYTSQRLTKGVGLVHIHPNSGANGNMGWRDYYNLVREREGDIELWGHSHEWDRFNMWAEIEEFLHECASAELPTR
jgi:peptidoglycan/xylan/chitin deacetylase (PgdA/CDA1 family)